MSKTIINAKNVTAGYRNHLVWQAANFTINSGEFVAVLGPNGAGKTTLFRLLLGFLQPLEGKITILGAEPKRGNPKIGYVPQRHFVDSDLKLDALELVRLGLNGHHWGINLAQNLESDNQKIYDVLKLVEAEHLANRPLGLLSGGELQRIFLAQALIGKPDLLLLDEPLANLDVRNQAVLVSLVSNIARQQNVTVLMIAHDLNPLLPSLDRVIYMANGRIAIGRPGEVVTSKSLSELYDSPVEVIRDSKGRVAVFGVEEATHPHDQ
jgi:zinc/manganese transport system ATP-binding protein